MRVLQRTTRGHCTNAVPQLQVRTGLESSRSVGRRSALLAVMMFADQPHVERHLSSAWQSGSRLIDSAIALLPNLIIAAVILAVFFFLASGAKSVVRHVSERRNRGRSLGVLLGQLTHVTVIVFGFLVAFSAVAPSFHAGDLIKMLGVGSVAIGFAFQNILQNFLAGILLLMQEPFQIGDWISVTGLEGKVEDIQTRATVVSTSAGQRIVIPNAVLFTSPVVVGKSSPEAREATSKEEVADHAGSAL